MVQDDLAVALFILRVVRGWSQDELAKRSGVRPSAISVYERGHIVPGLTTLRRLLTAMGYSFAALDSTQTFILTLRADGALRAAASLADLDPAPPAEGGKDGGGAAAAKEPAPLSPLHFQVEQASIEVGRVASRLTRLAFALVEARGAGTSSADAEARSGAA
jgi:transcriptional regulator with XRE-family HTH domain